MKMLIDNPSEPPFPRAAKNTGAVTGVCVPATRPHFHRHSLTAKFFRDWFIYFRIDKIHKQVVKFSKINPKTLDELAR